MQAVENQSFVLKITSFKLLEVSSLLLPAFLRYFRRCTWGGGGGHSVPPLVGIGLLSLQVKSKKGLTRGRRCKALDC